MSAVTLQIEKIDLRNATEREYSALNDFQNALHAERIPEDPPTPLEERVNWWKNGPELMCHQGWVVWNDDGTKIIADAGATFWRTEENKHALDFGIGVLPEHRRQGIARRILAHVASYAEQQNRPTLMVGTNDRVPGGAAFMRQLGAEPGLETHLNQLAIEDLNRELVSLWLQRAPERASGFDIGFWEGPYPEAELEAIAKLHGVMNTAPRGSLDLEDFQTTPAMLRDWERTMATSGDVRWTVYVRERATGAFAGFTEVFYHPNRPHLLWQGATGVFPQFRSHGLGRWLKAAMIDRVLRERPAVKFIRTGNADSNAPMLKINYELGFKPFIADCYWQVSLEKVQAYLKQREE
jgi:GNAT superfamily N-acetyltransferase